MKNNENALSFFTLALFTLALSATSNAAAVTRAENLVIVVINGVRYNDAFGEKNHLYIDNIWNKLKPLGTICTKFYNNEQTFPIPAQMSLLTGVWHILKDPLSETLRPAFPTLLEYWNGAHKAKGNVTYYATNNTAFEQISCSNHPEFGNAYAPVIEIERESDKNNAVYDKVMPYILEKHPSFIYLSLGTGIGGKGTLADVLGKEDNCDPRAPEDQLCGSDLLNGYYESIILMDAIIYDLWDRMQQEKTYKDNTVFLVLSVHGRHNREFHRFGDNSPGNRQLFMVAIGPGIKKDFVSDRKSTLIDICRTVGTLFDIPTPHAKGRVMKELFE